ncbi:MAG: ribonuclease HIII [Solobacterium sp.]|nr:ribonuclease HIII [Solobacterium sp.]
MSTITLKLNPSQRRHLFETLKEDQTNPPAYAEWQVRPEGCVITSYESGKVVFQGKDAEVYASPFQSVSEVKVPQAGSDEVGTGDYFGPVCVSASLVRKEDIDLLTSLGVKDSKALTDAEIRHIAPELSEYLIHTVLVVSPKKYNQVHARYNMNEIKALLHNQAYLNLSRKTSLPSLCVVDQFAEEPVYFHYLRYEKDVVRTLHFETKAENKYPAVGAASVLARYAFLQYMDKMDEAYDMRFAKGSGSPADRSASEFVQRYGMKKLGEVAKLHFKNTEKLNLK